MPTREQAFSQPEALRRLTGPGGAFKLSTDEPDGYGPLRVYDTGPKTLRELLIASRDFGDREFLIYEDERLTYLEHYYAVARLAAWLSAQGVGHGDRVGICMRNYPEWSIAFFACQAVGAIAVTLNAWWTADELAYGISDSGCSVAVLDHERYARLLSVLHRLPSLVEPRSFNEPRSFSEPQALQILVVRDPDRVYGIAHWEDALAEHSDVRELPAASVDPLDIATIMYTSGTTGVPKGALHSHRNHTTNIQNTLLAGAVARAQLTDDLAGEPPIPAAFASSILRRRCLVPVGCLWSFLSRSVFDFRDSVVARLSSFHILPTSRRRDSDLGFFKMFHRFALVEHLCHDRATLQSP